MKKIMIAIYDLKVEAFLNPITMQTEAEAVRWFILMTENEERGGMVSVHKEDYQLYQIGEWSDHDGQLKPVMKLLISGKSIAEHPPSEKTVAKIQEANL